MIKQIIFDLDGTLLDTTTGLMESILYTVNELKYPLLDTETLTNFIGPPIQTSFMKYYHCDERMAQTAAEIFRNYYKTSALFKAVPYKGVYQLMDMLQMADFSIAVATYKREDYALKILKHFGIDKYCQSMHGADNGNKLKKSDIVNLCISEMGGSRETSLLIGDTMHDGIGAQNAGVNFLGVTYGFGFKNMTDVNEFHPVGVAASPLEIYDILLELKQR